MCNMCNTEIGVQANSANLIKVLSCFLSSWTEDFNQYSSMLISLFSLKCIVESSTNFAVKKKNLIRDV